MPHDSLHTDAHDVAWSIRELLRSDRPRRTRRLPVDWLWTRSACARHWGGGLPPPARVIARGDFQWALREDQRTPILHVDTVEDHIARIVDLVRAVRGGVPLDPLVIGPDGDLWDGLHRLAALYVARVPEVDVIDFRVEQALEDVPAAGVADFVHPALLNERNRTLVAERLATAEPYPHFYLRKVLVPEQARAVARELEMLPWRLAETDFYEQYEMSLLDCEAKTLGPALRGFREAVMSDGFARWLAQITQSPALRIGDIACHKSVSGQQIGIHTDHSDEAEACRLTLHFNEGWQLEEGGLYVTFADHTPASAPGAYPPEMNTAILFKISERSFHCVTPLVGKRPRYSIVIAMTGAA